MKKPINCEECDECVYIAEGDYYCMLEEPRQVLEDFIVPTAEYNWCHRSKTQAFRQAPEEGKENG